MKSKMGLQYTNYSSLNAIFDPSATLNLDSPLSWSALSTPSPMSGVPVDLANYNEDRVVGSLSTTTPSNIFLTSATMSTIADHARQQLPLSLMSSHLYSPLTPEAVENNHPVDATVKSANSSRYMSHKHSKKSTMSTNESTIIEHTANGGTIAKFGRRLTDHHHSHQSHHSNTSQQCKICGDNALGKKIVFSLVEVNFLELCKYFLGKNFGVVTCGSCKIFFRRNISSKVNPK